MATLPKYLEYQQTKIVSKIGTAKPSQILAICFAFSKLPQHLDATMPRRKGIGKRRTKPGHDIRPPPKRARLHKDDPDGTT
jgi:hypothetical protein